MGSDGGFAPHFFLAGAAAEGGVPRCTSLGPVHYAFVGPGRNSCETAVTQKRASGRSLDHLLEADFGPGIPPVGTRSSPRTCGHRLGQERGRILVPLYTDLCCFWQDIFRGW
jgi:hypothetical protein